MTLEGHADAVCILAALEMGRLASGSMDHLVKIWDVGAGLCVTTLVAHTGPVRAIAVLEAGRLASGSQDGTVTIWDVAIARGIATHTPSEHARGVLALAAFGAGQLASGSQEDETIAVWEWELAVPKKLIMVCPAPKGMRKDAHEKQRGESTKYTSAGRSLRR